MPILDFKELASARSASPAGEALEGLVRELGKNLGLNPEWAGRGADQGRDLFFTELRKGLVGASTTRWLVSCKDFASSGRSVSEGDVGSVIDKVKQHGASGFLLATTTTASTGLKAMLDGIQAIGEVETKVWDRYELESFLLQDCHRDTAKQYLPLSFAAAKRFDNLPQALSSLEALLPAPVFAKIREVIELYHVADTWLAGERIWPHDQASADTIDLAISALIERKSAVEAAAILDENEIEYDAFEATLETLRSLKPYQAEQLCQELIKIGNNNGSALFAYRFYVDSFEPSSEQQIKSAVNLQPDDLHELYGDEIGLFIDEELTSNPSRFEAWSDLDALSSQTRLEETLIEQISFEASKSDEKIRFQASVNMSVELFYDSDTSHYDSFPGKVDGYIDSNGVFLERVVVDTKSFYE